MQIGETPRFAEFLLLLMCLILTVKLFTYLTLLHLERPKLYTILAFLNRVMVTGYTSETTSEAKFESVFIGSAFLDESNWKQILSIRDPNSLIRDSNTVELQWLEHLWDHQNMFETGVVRANEG